MKINPSGFNLHFDFTLPYINLDKSPGLRLKAHVSAVYYPEGECLAPEYYFFLLLPLNQIPTITKGNGKTHALRNNADLLLTKCNNYDHFNRRSIVQSFICVNFIDKL